MTFTMSYEEGKDSLSISYKNNRVDPIVNIIKVDEYGRLTALKEGMTTIYAKGNNSVIAKCDVVVKNGKKIFIKVVIK